MAHESVPVFTDRGRILRNRMRFLENPSLNNDISGKLDPAIYDRPAAF